MDRCTKCRRRCVKCGRSRAAARAPDEPFYQAAERAFDKSSFPILADAVGLHFKLEKATNIMGTDVIKWEFWPTKRADVDDTFNLRISYNPERGSLETIFSRRLGGSAIAEMSRASSDLPRVRESELIDQIRKDLSKVHSEVARRFG